MQAAGTREAMTTALNQIARKLPPWAIYLIGVIYPAWLFYLALTGQIGVDPVKALEHTMGLRGLQVLIAALCITPLRRFTGINLLRFRRAIGLTGAWFIFLHLLVWLFLDVRNPSLILADIIKRPYITIGMAAFVLLLPLVVTSNNASIRKLGRNWRKLHWLAYPATILGALHYVILVKGWQLTPILYFVALSVILMTRLPIKRWVARRTVAE